MKSILIIGMGRFGRHLCQNLAELGNQIMIVDQEEENLEDMLPLVVSAKIGDCTNENVLKSLGVANFDLSHFHETSHLYHHSSYVHLQSYPLSLPFQAVQNPDLSAYI